jgi:flap endonuclease-1
MGIKSLNAFIKKHAYNGIKDITISELQNKTIAIDTSIFMYKFMYSHRFIDNFIQQLFHLKTFNIRPIYIFDGKPPDEKKEVLDSRKENKEKISNKIIELEEKKKNLTNIQEIETITKEINNIRRKQIIVTKNDVDNLKKVFDILNVDYIQANCEADLLCCELYKNDKVYACLSNDMDFLPSGAGRLLRDYNLSNNLKLYDLNTILDNLKINYNQFVDFCILCGCDYTCKINRLGPETAFKVIKEYQNIEGILENMCGEGKQFKTPNNFDYQGARKLLKNNIENKESLNIPNIINDISAKLENKSKKSNRMISIRDINFILSNTKYSEEVIRKKAEIIMSS